MPNTSARMLRTSVSRAALGRPDESFIGLLLETVGGEIRARWDEVLPRIARPGRTYVEQDRSRADDYYLAEGSGVATRYVASPLTGVTPAGSLTGEAYEKWVAGFDPVTGVAKGRLRTDAKALRFVEVVVNGPKTWSLAAALHPEIADALDAAQTRAAEQIIGWVAEHATTRVGPKGRQVQGPVSEIEAAAVRHYTSRAGDPHRHLHLQINARVLVEQTWRGLHSVGMRDSLAAINGIGHAAVATDPEFHAVLTAHGFTLNATTGELAELSLFVGKFSARTAQIARNLDLFEAEWRAANPGAEPGPGLRQAWDRRAWTQARPDKVVPIDGGAMVARWNEELHALGYRDPQQVGLPIVTGNPRVGAIARDDVVEVVLSRLGAQRPSRTSAARSNCGSPPPVSWPPLRSAPISPRTSPPAPWPLAYTYGHLFEDRIDEVAAAMDAARGAERAKRARPPPLPALLLLLPICCQLLKKPQMPKRSYPAFPLARTSSHMCTPDGIRTRATALRGRRARPLHNGGLSRRDSSVRATREPIRQYSLGY